MEVTVISGQSLFDIAIQTCGTIEAIFEIAVLNNISITDPLVVGQVLSIPPPLNKGISEYYRIKNLTPATDLAIDHIVKNEGIGYWVIEEDFIVS